MPTLTLCTNNMREQALIFAIGKCFIHIVLMLMQSIMESILASLSLCCPHLSSSVALELSHGTPFTYITRPLRCNCTLFRHPSLSIEGSLMNIYRFTGSRCNIRIFKTTQHTPSPLMYVAGHSSWGNCLRLGLAPPASHPASRSVCIFISTRPNYAKARCQKMSHFEYSQPTGCNLQFFSGKTRYFSAALVIEVLNCCGQKINGKCYFPFHKHCYLKNPWPLLHIFTVQVSVMQVFAIRINLTKTNGSQWQKHILTILSHRFSVRKCKVNLTWCNHSHTSHQHI